MVQAVLAVLLAASAPAPITAADLAPLLTAGPESDAKAAIESGRYADAAARLAKSRSPEARFLRALALVEAHRPAEALAPLDGLEKALPDLADRVLHLRGEALLGAGRAREAVDAWAGVPDGSLLAAPARLERARAAASLGEP